MFCDIHNRPNKNTIEVQLSKPMSYIGVLTGVRGKLFSEEMTQRPHQKPDPARMMFTRARTVELMAQLVGSSTSFQVVPPVPASSGGPSMSVVSLSCSYGF